MARRTFVYGAVILLTANLLNRIMGFIYQYLIMTHIGGEAYGLFNMVFPVYMMALVFTTAGIPLAVSKLVSEEVTLGHYKQARAIFRLALVILTVSGILVAILLYGVAPRMAGRLFPDSRILPAFLICTPAIFVVSVSSAFRGYFQGLQNMLPTALSQTCEQIIRVICGFSAALYLLPRGVEWAAAGLALGMLAGEIAGLLAIILQYRWADHLQQKNHNGSVRPWTNTLARLWQLASPVTIGRLLATGLSTLDAMLIPGRLQAAGHTAREATTLFGQLGGAGFTLLTFPSVFTFALATSLVPAVAEATAKQSFQIVKARSFEAIRITIVFGVPCLVIIFYFAQPLTAFFKSANIAPVLRILAIGGIFSYLQQTTTGVLQGLGKAHMPVIHSIAAASVRIPLLYWLTGSPAWGLLGAAWAYVAGFFLVAFLNIATIVRLTGMAVDLNNFGLKPAIAALGMLLAFRLLAPSNTGHVAEYLAKLTIGIIVYLSIMALNKGITLGDLERIPGFGKLCFVFKHKI